jgi:hypothetical protein
MSAKDVREQIKVIQTKMDGSDYYNVYDEIRPKFLSDVNLLQQKYGIFLGNVKARHSDYFDKLDAMDRIIGEYFVALIRSSDYRDCFKLVNLASGKISELVSFVEALETIPPQEKVSKESYDKLVSQNKELNKTIEIMVKYKGLPELNELLENARNIELPTDEYWVLALCSSNLIEAVVNKKLEKLGEKIEGNFENRYKKLCRVINEKEKRDISQLLPLAIYNGIRNKLDHASNSNRVTPKEAKEISVMVKKFIDELFEL